MKCYILLMAQTHVSFHPGVAKRFGFFGRGIGPVFVEEVQCNGLEGSLLECGNTGLGLSTCDHYEDAGVICQGIYLSL